MYATTINCQLTEWGKTNSKIKSGVAGIIYYMTWLKMELVRILKYPRRMAEIRLNKAEGTVSLWVNSYEWKRTCPCKDCVRFHPIIDGVKEENE